MFRRSEFIFTPLDGLQAKVNTLREYNLFCLTAFDLLSKSYGASVGHLPLKGKILRWEFSV
jgi:hypothetical protein